MSDFTIFVFLKRSIEQHLHQEKKAKANNSRTINKEIIESIAKQKQLDKQTSIHIQINEQTAN